MSHSARERGFQRVCSHYNGVKLQQLLIVFRVSIYLHIYVSDESFHAPRRRTLHSCQVQREPLMALHNKFKDKDQIRGHAQVNLLFHLRSCH